MPKCIVDYCHNYAGMRKNYANVILHGFPTTLDRIKSWLRSLERGGQVFENLEEMATKIHEGKKHDSYRVCSEHFSKQCYIVSGEKKVLNKDAVPTVFTPSVMEPRCNHRQEPLSKQAKEFMKRRATEEPQHNSWKAKQFCIDNSKSVKHGEELTEIVLNLTLEIIYLLTGEDYALVKKTQSPITESSAHPQIHERNNEVKILKLTNKIIELLTGEVPIRCQDVAVHFTMEEWEYLKEHTDLYKDVMMKDHQPLTSQGLPCDQIRSLLQISCSNCANQITHSNSDHQRSSCLKVAKKVKPVKKEASATYSHLSTFTKEEPVSSDGGNITNTCGYTYTNHIEQYPLTQDMVEFVPSKGNVPPDANMYIPAKDVQNCLSARIKEIACLDGENHMSLGTYIPTDHTPHNPSSHIKVEYTLCEAEMTTVNPFHTPAAHTPHNPAAHIKVEYSPSEAESTTANTFYTPTDHTQCTSTHIKEEPVSYEDEALTDTNIYTFTNHLHHHPYPHNKEEPNTYNVGDATATYMSVPTPQYPSTHIKEEPVSLEERNVSGKTLSFQCMECSKGFTSKTDHAYHQTIHRIEKLKCKECGKYFSNKSNLSNHIRSHTGEKPFCCPACGKRFTRKSTLIIHQRIHTGEKPFVCLECGRCFPGKGNLMKHQKVHKAKKPMTVKSFLPMPVTLIVNSNVAPLQILH